MKESIENFISSTVKKISQRYSFWGYPGREHFEYEVTVALESVYDRGIKKEQDRANVLIKALMYQINVNHGYSYLAK